MDKATPSRMQPSPKRRRKAVDEKPTTDSAGNKYAPRKKVGTPTLGRSDNYVTRVGLGNLKVIDNGNPNVRPQ